MKLMVWLSLILMPLCSFGSELNLDLSFTVGKIKFSSDQWISSFPEEYETVRIDLSSDEWGCTSSIPKNSLVGGCWLKVLKFEANPFKTVRFKAEVTIVKDENSIHPYTLEIALSPFPNFMGEKSYVKLQLDSLDHIHNQVITSPAVRYYDGLKVFGALGIRKISQGDK